MEGSWFHSWQRQKTFFLHISHADTGIHQPSVQWAQDTGIHTALCSMGTGHWDPHSPLFNGHRTLGSTQPSVQWPQDTGIHTALCSMGTGHWDPHSPLFNGHRTSVFRVSNGDVNLTTHLCEAQMLKISNAIPLPPPKKTLLVYLHSVDRNFTFNPYRTNVENRVSS